MNKPTAAKIAKFPIVLLAVMTIVSFGGPFLLLWVLQGGTRRGWPPDRPLEWFVLIGLCSTVGCLMVLLLVMNLRVMKTIKAEIAKAKATGRGES